MQRVCELVFCVIRNSFEKDFQVFSFSVFSFASAASACDENFIIQIHVYIERLYCLFCVRVVSLNNKSKARRRKGEKNSQKKKNT